MKENLLLRALIMESVDWERRGQIEKELLVKLKKYEYDYSQSQKWLETLQNDKES